MLTFQETLWQLIRNIGRTVILLLAAAMLAGCMAFYLGNILANQEALAQLARTTKVEVMVTNATGKDVGGINIEPGRCENFRNNPYMENFRYSASAGAAYSQEEREKEPFTGGDAAVAGLNCLEATWMPDGQFTYVEGYDKTFLSGEEPLCLVNDDFAALHGIEMGDQVTMPLYFQKWKQGGLVDYTPMGEHTLTVVGFSSSKVYPLQFLVPVQWLRNTAEAQGIDFTYDTCVGTLKDPRQLNQFKEGIMEMSFLPPNPDAQDLWSGATIVVNDEKYITTAEELGKNITTFRQFLASFFVLIIGSIVLAIFLIMRGSKRDMAIACSLGRPKLLSALSSFLAALAAEAAGCLLVLPVMVLAAGLSLGGGLMICGAFLACACVGNALGLALILRFDVLTLLTASE